VKKSIKRLLTVCGAAFCTVLCACIMTGYPLSDFNNCSAPQLEGKWIVESRDKNGTQKTTEAEISDAGKVYLWKKKGETDSFFILTKLGTEYFVSVPAEKNSYFIQRIRFDGKEIEVLGLNEEGAKLAENEVYRKKPDGSLEAKFSQKEMQEWCLRNAGKFSTQVYLYRRAEK